MIGQGAGCGSVIGQLLQHVLDILSSGPSSMAVLHYTVWAMMSLYSDDVSMSAESTLTIF